MEKHIEELKERFEYMTREQVWYWWFGVCYGVVMSLADGSKGFDLINEFYQS